MKNRRPWLAFLLSFVCPGAGQLYNGNLKLAALALPLTAVLGLVGAIWLFGSIEQLGIALAVSLLFDFIFAMQAAREAKRLGPVNLKPYQSWWAYLLFGGLLYGLPGGYGLVMPERFLSFQIPSESMLPTLVVGDRLVADGWAFWGKGEPSAGDVITFKYPKDPSVIYVKRVVGVPGDTIEFRSGEFFLNNTKIEQKFLYKDGQQKQLSAEEQKREADNPLGATSQDEGSVFSEVLGGREHLIRRGLNPVLPDFGPITVPPASYFVMGDNRDRSHDSRFWGFVPRDAVVGKMSYVYFSWNKEAPWSKAFRSERFGLVVK